MVALHCSDEKVIGEFEKLTDYVLNIGVYY